MKKYSEVTFRSGPKRDFPHLYRLSGGFKTVHLNVAGWAALVGTGLALGAGIVFGTALTPPVALLAGVLMTWIILLAIDHYRWRNATVRLGWGDIDRDACESIVAKLEKDGIAAAYNEEIFEDEGESFVQHGITCRQADANKVLKMVNAAPSSLGRRF